MHNNVGTLGRVSVNNPFSINWKTNGKFPIIVFDHGIQIVGKTAGEKVLAFSQWRSTYSPGPIINGKAAMEVTPSDSSKYRVYKISATDDESNLDYKEWPSDLGAPLNENNLPLSKGSQNSWTIYNSLHSSIPDWFDNDNWDDLNPIPIEIQNYTYQIKSFSREIFNDILFLEFTIINKGTEPIDSAFIGFWTDIDLGSCLNDYPAVDTVNQLGYCWDDFTYDCQYDNTIAAGYTMLYGPKIENIGSNAIFKGNTVSDYKNMSLTAFHPILDEWDLIFEKTIASVDDAWNFANGLKPDGTVIIDPTTNKETKFPYSGNPVTNIGWLVDSFPAGEAGFTIYSGPFNFAPQDTQWVMFALVPGGGDTWQDAIIDMKYKTNYLQSLNYNSLLLKKEDTPRPEDILPKHFSLSQNYPNPFNPSTTIKYAIPLMDEDGTTTTDVTINIYDILGREITTLVNSEHKPGDYKVTFNPSEFNLVSGVYFYRIKAWAFVKTKKMLFIR